MHVLVTGATGFIGRALALRLRRSGHQIIAASRNPQRVPDLLGSEVRPVPIDDNKELAAAISQCDGVVHLAGASIAGRWTPGRKRQIRQSRVNLGSRLVRLIEGSSQPPHVLISASGVNYYGDRGDEIVATSDPRGPGFIGDLVADWEGAVNRARDVGVRVCTPRFGVVLARHGGALEAMRLPARLGLLGRLGSGEQWVSWIHLEDLVELLVTCLVDSRYRGAFHATSPTPVRQKQFAAGIASAVSRPSWVRVPGAVLKLALGEASHLLLDSVRARPDLAVSLGFQFRHPRFAPAMRAELSRPRTGVSRPPGDSPLRDYPKRQTVLSDQIVVSAHLPEVVEFFGDPRNEAALLPAGAHLRIQSVDQRTDDEHELNVSIKLGPVRLPLAFSVASPEPSRRIVDRQTTGPFKHFAHEHDFAVENGRTRVAEYVGYELPLGIIGRAIDRLFVRPRLRELQSYRRFAMRLRFGEPGRPRRRLPERPEARGQLSAV